MKEGRGGGLGTHVQGWMFPGRAWDKEDKGAWWTWKMGVERVVKTCSDGALDERNIKGLFVCFRGSCMFLHTFESHAELKKESEMTARG